MDRRYRLVCVLLLCFWCLLDASQGILVNVQTSVSISRVEPMGEQDPVEGDKVVLQYKARYLRNAIIEWSRYVSPETQSNEEVVARNGQSLDIRYTLRTERKRNVQKRIPTTDLKGQRTRSVLELTINASDDGSSYDCIVSISTEFINSSKYCVIGPLTVVSMTNEPPKYSTLATTSSVPHTSEMAVFQTTPLWITLSVLFCVFCIIITSFLIKHRHLKITNEKETNVAKADPYMELQPTEDKNRVYMEPTTATTTTQDTYYQPVEVETDSPEYDYARPDDPKEQRMNHQVSVHVEPVPSSEATDIRHTYYQLGAVQTDSPEYDYVQPTEGSTNTSHEVIREQSLAERPYQNINNNKNNKKRRLGVVVSPKFDYTLGQRAAPNQKQSLKFRL